MKKKLLIVSILLLIIASVIISMRESGSSVKVAGEDYSIIINANPRAAQAINGMLNVETRKDWFHRATTGLLRYLAALNTSYSPLFWITNFMRDKGVC